MRKLAILTRRLGMMGVGRHRTANTFRLRPLPQTLSSVAKGAPGEKVSAVCDVTDHYTAMSCDMICHMNHLRA